MTHIAAVLLTMFTHTYQVVLDKELHNSKYILTGL